MMDAMDIPIYMVIPIQWNVYVGAINCTLLAQKHEASFLISNHDIRNFITIDILYRALGTYTGVIINLMRNPLHTRLFVAFQLKPV
jgi:hypothetical protein